MLDHFSHSELACPTTDQVRLATGFGEALEKLRIKLDAPIYLTNACRSPSHNAKVNGHPRSLHLVINSHWGTGALGTLGTHALSMARLLMAHNEMYEEICHHD
ncbi:MAG: D-Ala-D-Ala carboxypeptidase family metallohydrolase [Alphaproteobacteria bacterium]|nr:D-Ala-D-Ala carboxypeptidase family metallohydrolase [Alphaproteobacteria bacterium]